MSEDPIRDRVVRALGPIIEGGWNEALQAEGFVDALDADAEVQTALRHYLAGPCDLPDDHDGPCWFESGTEDD